MSSRSHSSKPKNLQDLVEFGYENPYLGLPPYPWAGVFDQKDPQSKKWIQRSEAVPNFSSLVRRLRSKPKQSLIGTVFNGNIFIPMTPIPIPYDVLSDYEVIDSCIGEVYEGFAFHQGSPFLKQFNWYLNSWKQFGLIEKVTQDALLKVSHKQHAYREVMIKSVASYELKPLSLIQLKKAFRALLIGLFLALLTFLSEIYFYQRKEQKWKSPHQLLRWFNYVNALRLQQRGDAGFER